jgi:hypothetical protein
MKQVNATEILDMAMSGTNATLLASYEDSSLSYTGIDRHAEIDEYVGGFDTGITMSEFEEMRKEGSDMQHGYPACLDGSCPLHPSYSQLPLKTKLLKVLI